MEMSTTKTLGGVAAGAVALGSVTPWATASFGFFSVSVSGIDGGDGWFTVAAAVLAVIGLVLSNRWLFGVPMFVAAGIVAIEVLNISGLADDNAVAVQIGWGLLLLGAGAVLGSVMALMWPGGTAPTFGDPRFPAAPPRPFVPSTPAPGTAPSWQWDGQVYRWWDGHGWTFHTAARGEQH